MTKNIPGKKFETFTGGLICFLGILVLVGWVLDNPMLEGIVPGVKPMNPLTAFSFILCGTWVLIYKQKKRATRICAWLICIYLVLFGLLHLVTFEFAISKYRMDYLLFRNQIANEGAGAMIPPNTALGFLIDGLIMLSVSIHWRWVIRIRQYSILFIFLMSYISILGYIFKIQPEYTLGGLTPMSLFTGITFLILNTSLLISNRRFPLTRILIADLNSSRLIRGATPFILIFPPILGYFRLLGEKIGLYPSEFGVELNTVAFVICVFLFLSLYTRMANKKQVTKLRTDLKLAISEQNYKALFNSINEGIMSVNFNGNILYCNPSFCKMTGYEEHELVGKNPIEFLITPNRREAFYQKLAERQKGTDESYQTEMLRKNKEKIWVSVKSKPLISHEGKQYGFISSIEDITEELHQLQDLQAFTVSAAHDLNSPLARIVTIADLLNSTKLDEDQTMFVEILNTTAIAMRDLLKDLLLFSRLGSEQMEKESTDLNKLVSEVLKETVPTNYKGKLSVQPLSKVEANAPALKRLLTNLISNAIKYSADKENQEIEVGQYFKNDIEVYYVKDNGSGLSDDAIKNMFTPFKRFHSGIEGNGMGLAIVKRIAEKHGGTVWAKHNPEGGLIVCFTLRS